MKKTSYFPDIDGLRAIAILLVLLYHAFPHFLTGGFVGVDVFFVISGYLITSIIIKELDDKKFKFVDFYSRRIVRLFPALLLLFITLVLFGKIYLLPPEFQQLGDHITAGSLFSANFQLLSESGYFDTIADSKLLLHLWSLSIEEQFYILWPLFLVCFRKVLKKKIIYITLIFVLTSFLFSFITTYQNPSRAFYLPWSRFWEIGLGVILSLCLNDLQKKEYKVLTFLKTYVFSFLGLGFIIFSAIFYHKLFSFPGWRALLPTFGTVFIILGSSSWINRKILSNNILVYIGLLSYPLYLWHWPLLSFGHIIFPEKIPTKYAMVCLGVAMILAMLTYHLVEKKIKILYIKQKYIVTLFLLAGMISMIFIGKALSKKKIHSLKPSPEVTKVLNASADSWGFPDKNQKAEVITPYLTVYSQGLGEKVILFFGDSNVEIYAPRVAYLFDKKLLKDTQVLFITKHSCPPIFSISDNGGFGCEQFGKDVKNYIQKITKNNKIYAVVFGAQWTGYLGDDNPTYKANYKEKMTNQEKIIQALKDTLTFFNNKADRKFLILNIPVGVLLNPLNTISRISFKGRYIDPVLVSEQEEYVKNFATIFKPIKDLLHEKLKDDSKLQFLDPINSFNFESKNRLFSPEGEPFYRDCCHIRPFFVRDHVTFLDEIFISRP